MALITTKGRARQKAQTLAKKAGVEIKAVVFSKSEAEKALGYKLRGRLCTKRDPCWGRAFTDSKVIWLSLPTGVKTIAHEVMHLVTSTNHNEASFQNKVVALQRGKCPASAKARDYDVTVITEAVYRVHELSPSDAKKHYYRQGKRISTEQHITARQCK